MLHDVAFVDTETTGLDPDRHQIWEVAAIVDGKEWLWHLPVDLGRADPIALKIGRFHERHGVEEIIRILPAFAREFAALTRGRHLVGAVVSFDEERLRKVLRSNGACPEWHYHLIDVEALAAGRIMGYAAMHRGDSQDYRRCASIAAPPWDSEELSRTLGIDPEQFDRHTALGDARWAKAIYDAVVK